MRRTHPKGPLRYDEGTAGRRWRTRPKRLVSGTGFEGATWRICSVGHASMRSWYATHLPLCLRAKESQNLKYWIDTEFIERPYTIDLISIGLIAEDDREFYAESSEVDWSKAGLWTLENVRPQLDGKGVSREEIGYAVRQFTNGDEHPVFWGYFPAYDWVAFSWLFGNMDELPFHYPQLCLDIKHWAIVLGDPELPHQLGARHHALLDARWTRDAWAFLARLDPTAGERWATGRKNPDQVGRAS